MYHLGTGWKCWNDHHPERTYTCKFCQHTIRFRQFGSHVRAIHEDGGWDCWRNRLAA